MRWELTIKGEKQRYVCKQNFRFHILPNIGQSQLTLPNLILPKHGQNKFKFKEHVSIETLSWEHDHFWTWPHKKVIMSDGI
jgi:hypothetical protein